MIALVTALLLSAQEPEWNCDNPQAQQEMNYCAARDAEQADAELNAAYRPAIEQAREADREYARISDGAGGPNDGGPGEEATLREAQRAWVSFREAQCRMESFEARGGSMQPMIESACRAALTRARTAELRGPNPECPQGDSDQAAINRCLTGVYDRADTAMNGVWRDALASQQRTNAPGAARLQAAQRAWLAYRDAHCESVANAELGAELAASQTILCRTAMTQARTQELENFVTVEP
jgi:uncharacterized protein YecT (DUF1311 family)